MLAVIGFFLTLLTSMALIFSAQLGILLAFVFKPIVDTAWSFAFVGISPPKLLSGLFPLLVLLHARGQGKGLSEMPLFGIWIVFVIYILFSATSGLFSGGILLYLDSSLRVLNGIAGFYAIQAYFADRESFRKLLKFLLLASIFPLSVAMYQMATGAVFQERMAVGFSRNVGFYHDSIVLRQYGFQAIMAVILYWSYFIKKDSDSFKKVILSGIAAAAVIAIFNLYSKAGYVIIAVWALVWTVSKREFTVMAGLLVVIIAINIVFYDRISSVTTQVYWKEISAIYGDNTSGVSDERRQKRAFSGRFYVWEELIESYSNASVFEQLFGRGHGTGAHNDYLHRLLANGLIGLLLYVVLLWAIGSRVIRNYFRRRQPIDVMALMLFLMWMIDTIGLVPSAYTGYQWYVWGIIALSIKAGDRLGDAAPEVLREPVRKPLAGGRVKQRVLK